jgi:hypothetical protein
MDGVMRVLALNQTQLKEDFFFAVKLARQKQFKYFTDVATTSGMHLVPAHILDPFRKWRLFTKWDKRMYINPEDDTSYTIQ